MKKTMKKLTALTLIFMLLFSAFSVQASAISLFDKITEVALGEVPTVTEREIEAYIAYMDEIGWEEEDYLYPVYVPADVTISTGEVIFCDEYGDGISDNAQRIVMINAYLDIREFQQAVESGADTVTFHYDAVLYSSLLIELDSFSGTGEAPIAECYVKNLTAVSGIPESYQCTSSFNTIIIDGTNEKEFILEGAVFDIEYPDGRIVRATVEKNENENGYEYCTLDGNYIDYWVDDEEGIIEICFEDFTLYEDIEIIPFPIAEITIDDVTVTDDFEAESVTYTVTNIDGTAQSFTFTFDGEPDANIIAMPIYLGEYAFGMPVIIVSDKYEGEEYPIKEYLGVVVLADYGIHAETEIEGPAQEDTLLGRILYRIRMFLMKIFEFLFYLY